MSADYRVDITIGPTLTGVTYSWTINKGDVPTLAAPEIRDGLTFGYQFPETNLWPVQPEPVSAGFSIVAESADDLAGIDRGTPVLIRVWAGLTLDAVDYDTVTFTGRVAEAAGYPIKFGHPVTGDEVNGWQVELQCVDTVADNGERTVAGYFPFQGMGVRGHVNGRFGLADVPIPAWGDGGSGTPLLVLNEGLLDPADLASAVERLLAAYADGGPITGDPTIPGNHAHYYAQGWRRGILRPNVDTAGVLDPDNPLRMEWISRRYGAEPGIGPVPPAVFADLGAGLYGPVIEAPPDEIDLGGGPIPIYDAGIVIDADYLSYNARWTRSKFDDPNTIDVANNIPEDEQSAEPWSSVTVSNRVTGETVVGAAITDSLISDLWDAASVGEMYLDDSSNTDSIWAASGFRWYASDDPAWPVARSLFPEAELFGEYGAPITITGIPAHQRPHGRPWYVGVPRSVTFTFERGSFYFDLDLYPRVPRPMADFGIGLTCEDLADRFPAVTSDDLDPAYTSIDYRLIRSAIYYP